MNAHTLWIVNTLSDAGFIFLVILKEYLNKLTQLIVCNDSHVIYSCSFNQVGKWSGFTESMRINEKDVRQYKYNDLVGMQVYLKRQDLIVFMWFFVILSYS